MNLKHEKALDFILDEHTPKNAKLSPLYKWSFAYPTMKDRTPVILTGIIDRLHRDKENITKRFSNDKDSEKVIMDEIKAITADIAELKHDLLRSKPLVPFADSDRPEISIWNADLENKKLEYPQVTYFQIDWLFCECYIHRRIIEAFFLRSHLCEYDPYEEQKGRVLEQAIPSYTRLIKEFVQKGYFDDNKTMEQDEIESILSIMIKNCLWSNRVDLCLKESYSGLESSILVDLKKWDGKILVDDTKKAIKLLLDIGSKEGKTIEIVTDNAGHEILADLCLADFLVSKCGVTNVGFNVKPFPWFVSDVTCKDLEYTISKIENHEFPECQMTGKRWRGYLKCNKWTLRPHHFWVLGKPYETMLEVSPTLYETLQDAHMVIFKGDLNYRKLVQDKNWDPPTQKFSCALGKFHPTNLLAIRTNKADTIAGLKPGVAEAVSKISKDWLISGEYGVIQLDTPFV